MIIIYMQSSEFLLGHFGTSHSVQEWFIWPDEILVKLVLMLRKTLLPCVCAALFSWDASQTRDSLICRDNCRRRPTNRQGWSPLGFCPYQPQQINVESMSCATTGGPSFTPPLFPAYSKACDAQAFLWNYRVIFKLRIPQDVLSRSV